MFSASSLLYFFPPDIELVFKFEFVKYNFSAVTLVLSKSEINNHITTYYLVKKPCGAFIFLLCISIFSPSYICICSLLFRCLDVSHFDYIKSA